MRQGGAHSQGQSPSARYLLHGWATLLPGLLAYGAGFQSFHKDPFVRGQMPSCCFSVEETLMREVLFSYDTDITPASVLNLLGLRLGVEAGHESYSVQTEHVSIIVLQPSVQSLTFFFFFLNKIILIWAPSDFSHFHKQPEQYSVEKER